MRRSGGTSHDHEVVLRSPPCGGQGNRVVGVHKFGVEVGDYLLGGSTYRQGNISTSCRGAEGHDQGRPCRSLRHRGKGGGGRASGRGGSRGSGRLGMGFRGGLGRGFLSSSCLGRGPGAVDFSSELLDLASQRGEGRIKGGAEEPKLLLGEGGGSGGGRGGGGGRESKHSQRCGIAQLRVWPGKKFRERGKEPRRVPTTRLLICGVFRESIKERFEEENVDCGHFRGMVVVRGKGVSTSASWWSSWGSSTSTTSRWAGASATSWATSSGWSGSAWWVPSWSTLPHAGFSEE